MLNPFALVMAKLASGIALAGAGSQSRSLRPVPRQLFESQVEPLFREVRLIHHEEMALLRSRGNRRTATHAHEYLRLTESETRADTALAIAQAHLRRRDRLYPSLTEFFVRVQDYLCARPADGYCTPVETPRLRPALPLGLGRAPFNEQEELLKVRWWAVAKSYGDVKASVR